MHIKNTISTALNEFNKISQKRKVELLQISDFIRKKEGKANLLFICTHNSRRSHLCQVWAQVAAWHFGFLQVTSYSGGTEETAVFPSTIEALSQQGLDITKLSLQPNPIYSVKYDANTHPIVCFSKKFNNLSNPQSEFAAIMTCDHANETCPFIPEVGIRIAIQYEDPKIADGRPQQQRKYNERSNQICREMLYAFSCV